MGAYRPTGFNFHTMKLSREVSAFVDLPRVKVILAALSIIFGPAPRIPPTASAGTQHAGFNQAPFHYE